MKIHSIYDPEFKPYGQVLEGYDTACLLKAMETIPLPENVEEVVELWCEAATVSPRMESGGPVAEGKLTISMLAKMEDGQLYYFDKVLEVNHKFPCEVEGAALEARISCQSCTWSASGNDALELRCQLELTGSLSCPVRAVLLEDIEVDEKKPKEDAAAPGLYLYLADSGETLWDIAKRYNTNIDKITEENPEEDYTQVRPIHAASGRSLPEHRYEEEDYPPQRRRRYEDEEDYSRRRGPIWPVLLAVAAVLLFVGLIFSFLWKTIFPGILAPPETHTVPKLVGEAYDAVKDNTELLAGFTLIEGETVANDADPGTIIDQEPKGGKEVGENVTEIKVTISGGPEVVKMIRLDDMDYQTASTALRNIGLKAGVPSYENSETIEQGFVISYTPMEGVEVPPGTEVQIVLSKGPEDKPFPMPKLVGMTKARALAEIENKNLQQGNVEQEEYDDEIEEGKVISQYPLENAEVTEGTEVNLVISKGPDPANKPPEPPAGNTKTVSVPLHGYEGMVSVRLLMDGVEVGSKLEDATLNEATPFEVTGTGQKELAYYINGEARGTIPVNFDE